MMPQRPPQADMDMPDDWRSLQLWSDLGIQWAWATGVGQDGGTLCAWVLTDAAPNATACLSQPRRRPQRPPQYPHVRIFSLSSAGARGHESCTESPIESHRLGETPQYYYYYYYYYNNNNYYYY